MKQSLTEKPVYLRAPTPWDAADVYDLVRRSKPLDPNSVYCYILLCDHFRSTCIVAESESQLVGFISAYIPPGRKDTVFVWQVAVDEAMRNRSLATKMLKSLLARDELSGLHRLETTVTPSNRVSMAFFKAFASKLGAPFSTGSGYGAELFGDEGHEEELLITIGPFVRAQPR